MNQQQHIESEAYAALDVDRELRTPYTLIVGKDGVIGELDRFALADLFERKGIKVDMGKRRL